MLHTGRSANKLNPVQSHRAQGNRQRLATTPRYLILHSKQGTGMNHYCSSDRAESRHLACLDRPLCLKSRWFEAQEAYSRP